MTEIQVKYWANKESQRHNFATENQAAQELTESHRHNVTTEGINQQQVSENVRHNKVGEAQNERSLNETKRHNIVGESQNLRNIKETKRHNIAGEKLTARNIKEAVRHNKAGEALSAQSNAIAQQDANTRASKVKAENALTYAKAWAQKWMNEWKRTNPTIASLKEAGVMTNSTALGQALQAAGLASDTFRAGVNALSKEPAKISESDIQRMTQKAIRTKKASFVGTDGKYKYYQLTGLSSKGKGIYFAVDKKTGKYYVPDTTQTTLAGGHKNWLGHALGSDN